MGGFDYVSIPIFFIKELRRKFTPYYKNLFRACFETTSLFVLSNVSSWHVSSGKRILISNEEKHLCHNKPFFRVILYLFSFEIFVRSAHFSELCLNWYCWKQELKNSSSITKTTLFLQWHRSKFYIGTNSWQTLPNTWSLS